MGTSIKKTGYAPAGFKKDSLSRRDFGIGSSGRDSAQVHLMYAGAFVLFFAAIAFVVVMSVREGGGADAGASESQSGSGSAGARGDEPHPEGDSMCMPPLIREEKVEAQRRMTEMLATAGPGALGGPKSSLGAHSDGLATIFVSIASYRDDECKDTVYEMFERARYPENISVGVVQQNKADKNAEDCFDSCEKCRKRKEVGQIRVLSYDFSEARGPCFARYKASTLWRGERWYLQIDSHTKFADGWDVTMLNQLARTNDPMAVLGAYPPTEGQMEDIVRSGYRKTISMCRGQFNSSGIPEMKGVVVNVPPDSDGAPLPVAFVGAGFLCFPGHALAEVPFDPYLAFLFFGEEILFCARLWTSGYNFYAPSRSFLVHHYERGGKPRFWDDLKDFERCRDLAVKRVKYILGLDGQTLEDIPADYREDIEEYGLGHARAIEDYWAYAGIDPQAKTVQDKCATGYKKLG